VRLTPLRSRATWLGGLGALCVASTVAWAGRYSAKYDAVNMQTLRADVLQMEALGSRVTGYPGCEAAADLVADRFRKLGLQDVSFQEFKLPVPLEKRSSLRIGGGLPPNSRAAFPSGEIPLAAFWPNLVRTPQLGPAGLTGKLVYGGSGDLSEFNRRPVKGSIVVLEFNCGLRWLNAAELGAKAAIFIEPAETTRGEAEQKFLRAPLNFPRFFLSREDAERLHLAELSKPGTVSATLNCAMPWENATVRNVYGFLEGTDPKLKQQCLILTAYYDSISVVPGRAPGADQSCGIATLLEMARLLTQAPPKRSVIFLAVPGHFEGLAGALRFLDVFGREKADEREKQFQRLDKAVRKLEGEKRLSGSRHNNAMLELRSLEGKQGVNSGKRRVELNRKVGAYQREMDACDLEISWIQAQKALAAKFRKCQLPLVIGLDLTSQNDAMAVSHVGYYFRDEQLTRFFSPIGKQCTEYVTKIGKERSQDLSAKFVDGINPTQDRNWATFFPGKVAFDAEMATRTGRPGITFATVNDNRGLFNTPLDTSDRMNFGNLERQARLLACLLDQITNDPRMMEGMLKRIKGLRYELDDVVGSVLWFEREKSFLPNTPLEGGLVVVQGMYKSAMGVHTDLFSMAGPAGRFATKGQQDFGSAELEAYGLDPQDGRITFAPDLGNEGEKRYPRNVLGRVGLRRPVIVFPCSQIDLYDLVDERYFETLEQIFLYDGATDSEPLSFGCSVPLSESTSAGARGGGDSLSYVEPCAVVYAMPHSKVKITMGMGLLGLRLVLVNTTAKHPEGEGFPVDTTPSIPLTPFRVAQDLHNIDRYRIRDLVAHGILNQRMQDLHDKAGEEIRKAEKAFAAEEYDQGLSAARVAWAFESRAYPDVQRTALDVVKGVLFYLAMLLPFAFFGERLFLASPDIKKQIGGTLGVFLIVFWVLRYVHPAFELRVMPLIILLAFVIGTLAVVVISIVTGKFNEQLEKLKQEMQGVHQADVGRMSALNAAFALGIGNMRRRKSRSILTSVTLVLLTFTVLSFTSVRSYIRRNEVGLKHKPPYYGLMIRDKVWSPMEEPTYEIIANEFASRAKVIAPRAWISSENYDKRAFYDVLSVQDPTKTYVVNGIVGLSPAEQEISGIGDQVLRSGKYGSANARWFREGDQYLCLLPQTIAEALGVTGRDLGRAQVELYGMKFTVLGVIPDKALDSIRDLDHETMTPVDYAQLKPEVLEELKRQRQQKFKLGKTGEESLLQEYTHFQASNVLVVPYRQAMNMYGTLRSISLKLRKPEDVQTTVQDLVERFALSIYAGEKGAAPDRDRSVLYSSVGLSSFSGLETVLIPILIAAMIVLNTMLGAVYERTKEIGIYSSVGLAPVHISTLFLAESCVYANIGAVLGYLIGQVLGSVLSKSGLMPGLELNYSSMSAVGVTLIVVATVILSTLYPARKAAEMAVPDVERKWKLPEPEGDEMQIRLPFMLTGGDSKACSAFLVEFFEAYVDYTGGEFYTDAVHFEATDTEYGEGYSIKLRMWLAPYDLGVSQTLDLRTSPTEEGEVYEVVIHLYREAGDISSWKKTNWLFLNVIRKQFLIWRTISPPARRGYEHRAEETLTGAEPVQEAA